MIAKEEIIVTHFDITRCGYYKPHGRNNSHLFGDTKSFLTDLAQWAIGVDLVDTQTFPPSAELLPTYLLDVKSANGEFLVGTWNGIVGTTGQVLSVPATSKVGAAAATAATLPPGNIAGYATYFWFRPKEDRFTTVQFSGALNGRQNLLAYANSFLAKFDPNHVVAKTTNVLNADAHKCIKGYRKSPKPDSEIIPLESAYPVFDSVLVRSDGKIDEIRKNLDSVHTIIRKETIKATTASGKSHLSSILGVFGVEKATTNAHEYRVRYQVKYQPSMDEFNAMVDAYNALGGHEWDDIGFMISGRSSPIWLSGSVARIKAEIEIVRDGYVVDAAQLLATLQHNRRLLLRT